MTLTPDAGFTVIADRVWVARHSWHDLNVTVVAGTAGVVVVDTGASDVAARADVEAVRTLVGDLPVLAVVNTHDHFDHWFGNGAWRAAYPDVALVAHDEAAAAMRATAASPTPDDALADDPRREEALASVLVPADTTFSSVHVVDLGDRSVEVVHPGAGHSGGDVVVRVEGADVLVAGDLVEESSGPAYGADSHPMSWPPSLDLVLSLIGPGTVVVPGHGDVVDQAYVEEQRSAIGVVAETIRDLAGRGVPVGEALAAGEWPYPSEDLPHAVRRGYEALPRTAKHLPLI